MEYPLTNVFTLPTQPSTHFSNLQYPFHCKMRRHRSYSNPTLLHTALHLEPSRSKQTPTTQRLHQCIPPTPTAHPLTHHSHPRGPGS